MNKEEILNQIKNLPDDVYIVGFDIFYLEYKDLFNYVLNDYCKFEDFYIKDIRKLLMSRFFFEDNESFNKILIDNNIKLLNDINKIVKTKGENENE